MIYIALLHCYIVDNRIIGIRITFIPLYTGIIFLWFINCHPYKGVRAKMKVVRQILGFLESFVIRARAFVKKA